MKIGTILFLIFFTFSIFTTTMLIASDINTFNEVFDKEVRYDLADTIDSRLSQINNYLHKMEMDMNLVSLMWATEEVFSKPLIVKKNVAREDVLKKSKIISKEIENFLLANPEMTLKDLQSNLEFQSIATQSISENGYTTIYGKNVKEILFHPIEKFVGKNYEDVMKISPELMRMTDKILEGADSSEGYYVFPDKAGNLRGKFAVEQVIHIKTADDVSMILVTTSYVEEYTMIQNLSEISKNGLLNLVSLNKYYDLFFTSPSGNIIYSAIGKVAPGTNLENKGNLRLSLSNLYTSTKNSSGMKFYGPFYLENEDKPLFAITMPLYLSDKYIGRAYLLSDMDRIYNIIKNPEGLGKTGEIYLVNSDTELISPSRFGGSDIFTQAIETENVLECLDDIKKGTPEEFTVIEFLNYRGDLTLGFDHPIPKMNWCLIVEKGKAEVSRIKKESNYSNFIYFGLGLLIILILVSFFTKQIADKKFKLMKKTRTEKRMTIFRYIDRFEFLKNTKPLYVLILSLIIFGGIYLLFEIIFKGALLFDLTNITEIISLSILALILRTSYFCKNQKSREFIFFGIFVLFFSETLQIILQLYDGLQITVLLMTIINRLAVIIGIVSFLFGFSEEIK